MKTTKLARAAEVTLVVALAACKRAPKPDPTPTPAPTVSAVASASASASVSPTAESPPPLPTFVSPGPTDPKACGKGTATFTSSAAGCGFKVVGVSAAVLKGDRLRVSLSSVPEKVMEIMFDACEFDHSATERRLIWLDVPLASQGKVEVDAAWSGPINLQGGYAAYNVYGKARNGTYFANKGGSITMTKSDGSSVEGSFSIDIPEAACAKPTKLEGTFKAKICCRATPDSP